MLQYEYALRHLYALVNLCEEGYTADRYRPLPVHLNICGGGLLSFLLPWRALFVFFSVEIQVKATEHYSVLSCCV